MEQLQLSDLAWIGVGVGLYLLATSHLPAALIRRLRPMARVRSARPTLPIHRVMSRTRVVRAPAEPAPNRLEPAEPIPVRAQQNQLEPIEPPAIEPVREPARLNRLSRTEEIALLAVLRDEQGRYRHSANDITRLMGGTAAEVKKQIAEIRALPPEEQPKPPARVDRPTRGWPKTA